MSLEAKWIANETGVSLSLVTKALSILYSNIEDPELRNHTIVQAGATWDQTRDILDAQLRYFKESEDQFCKDFASQTTLKAFKTVPRPRRGGRLALLMRI